MTTFRISQDLLMKAAKFQQNHKIKADTIVFDEEAEVIQFIDKEDAVVAYTEYVQDKGTRKCWYSKA